MHVRARIQLVALAVMLVSSQAHAADITFDGMGLNKKVRVSRGGNHHVHAGELLISFEGEQHVAYCVDFEHRMKNQWTASAEPVSFIDNGLAAAWLYDNFAAGVSDKKEAAALQLAIWEVVDDFGTLDLTDGVFSLRGSRSLRTLAEDYLDALPDDLTGYTPSSYILASGAHPQSQHLIVPEPGTIISLLLGIPAILATRRRSGV